MSSNINCIHKPIICNKNNKYATLNNSSVNVKYGVGGNEFDIDHLKANNVNNNVTDIINLCDTGKWFVKYTQKLTTSINTKGNIISNI